MSLPLLALAPTTLPHTPTLEFLDAAHAAGFPAVSLRLNASPGLPFHPVVGNAAAMREVTARIRDTGLQVLEVVSFYLRPDTDIATYMPALEFGAQLGARYALTMGDDPDPQRQVASFGRFCDRIAPLGLTAAVEFAVSRPIATLTDTTGMIAAAGRANSVVCLDPLNHCRALDVEAIGAVDARLYPYAQLTDGVIGPGEPHLARARANGANVRRWPGEGDVPLGRALDLLPAGIPLAVEGPFPDSPARTAREWAAIALDRSREFLERRIAK